MNDSNVSGMVWESAVPPSLQFAFGVTGNITALLILVCSSTTHKWQTFYKLVAGLALTDGGGILLMYPPILARYATDFTFHFPKNLCAYNSFLTPFTILSSALIVCAMSIDRFMAVYFPFYYMYNVEKGDRKRAVFALLFIWTSGALISSLHLMGLGSVYYFYPGSWCFLNFVSDDTFERVNASIYSGLGLLALFVTVFLKISVIAALVKGLNHTEGHLRRVKKMSTTSFLRQ
ncbi:prostaglandin E2 receptor EP4 subtype-like [Saccostrea echinata]|uniref:prostaglandin E2 receptor EP4 subtype-like n=1 Tax=Saccostrea echinata TaxID=191078 RepID=UPI002A81A8FA|nr:prostaglandin E2 receptor EP4 subtype-like [Saccostrea echinata]